MAETLNICGVVVYLGPDADKGLVARILALPGVELEAASGECRLAVTIVDTPASLAIEQITAIHRLPGVVAASLIFHAVDMPDGEIDTCEHGASACCAGESHQDGANMPIQQLQFR